MDDYACDCPPSSAGVVHRLDCPLAHVTRERALVAERDALRADLRAVAEAARWLLDGPRVDAGGAWNFSGSAPVALRDALARPGVQGVLETTS